MLGREPVVGLDAVVRGAFAAGLPDEIPILDSPVAGISRTTYGLIVRDAYRYAALSNSSAVDTWLRVIGAVGRLPVESESTGKFASSIALMASTLREASHEVAELRLEFASAKEAMSKRHFAPLTRLQMYSQLQSVVSIHLFARHWPGVAHELDTRHSEMFPYLLDCARSVGIPPSDLLLGADLFLEALNPR